MVQANSEPQSHEQPMSRTATRHWLKCVCLCLGGTSRAPLRPVGTVTYTKKPGGCDGEQAGVEPRTMTACPFSPCYRLMCPQMKGRYTPRLSYLGSSWTGRSGPQRAAAAGPAGLADPAGPAAHGGPAVPGKRRAQHIIKPCQKTTPPQSDSGIRVVRVCLQHS